MASPAEIYANGINSRLRNYFAAWLPDTHIDLGDVGTLDGSFFTPIANLKDSGINVPFKARNDTDPSSLQIQSEHGVTTTFKTKGNVSAKVPNVPKGEAGVSVEFSHAGAFIFEAPKTYDPNIENILDLQEKVVHKFGEGDWDLDWAIVTRVVQAPSATVLVSRSSSSSIEFSAKGDLVAGAFDLGDAEIELGRHSQSGDIIRMVGARDITPFFQLVRIKVPPFRIPHELETLRGRMSLESRSRVATRGMITPRRVREGNYSTGALRLELIEPPGIE